MNSKEISVIVQGAINQKETPKCLKSIRKYLPEAEIILSTWEGSIVENLDFDILVLNKDPGAIPIDKFKDKLIYNNMNRQLLSTQEGLKRATRKYALKLRSDLILSNINFLNYYEKFPIRDTKYKIFNHKLLASCIFSRFKMKSKNGINYMPFHISDWWFFGELEDLNKYFRDTEIVKEPYFTTYFDQEENINKKSPYGKARFKFAPEQYFGYSCLKRYFNYLNMEDASDYNDTLMEDFRKIFINNFITLEHKASGIYMNKYLYSKNEKFIGEEYLNLYNWHRYELEYQKYCDNKYKFSPLSFTFKYERKAYWLLKILKHIYQLIAPNSTFIEKLEQLFISIPGSILRSLIFMFKI